MAPTFATKREREIEIYGEDLNKLLLEEAAPDIFGEFSTTTTTEHRINSFFFFFLFFQIDVFTINSMGPYNRLKSLLLLFNKISLSLTLSLSKSKKQFFETLKKFFVCSNFCNDSHQPPSSTATGVAGVAAGVAALNNNLN